MFHPPKILQWQRNGNGTSLQRVPIENLLNAEMAPVADPFFQLLLAIIGRCWIRSGIINLLNLELNLLNYNVFAMGGPLQPVGHLLRQQQVPFLMTNWCKVAGPHGWDPPLEAYQTRDRRPGGPNYSNRKLLQIKNNSISTPVTISGIHKHFRQDRQMECTIMLPTFRGIDTDRNINTSPIKNPTDNLHLISKALHHYSPLCESSCLDYTNGHKTFLKNTIP